MTTPAMLPPDPRGVLVASPNSTLREQVRKSLDERAGPVLEVIGGADALAKLESGQWPLLFLDRSLPDLNVDELMGIIQARFPGTEVVLVDSDVSPSSSRSLPLDTRLRSWLRPAADVTKKEEKSSASANRPAAAEAPLPGMIGASEPMQRLYRMTRLVAAHNTTVLIMGATGTGKELVARAIHQLSRRASGPWAVVNCAAIPEALLEAELFGYARGAFTGAVQTYSGRICSAQGGTLFLDEVGELPLNLQAKLLRFLEQKEIQRLGSAETLRVDVRVVAATNADLEQQVDAHQFRSDLYYRLSAFPLELPRLAARREDILPLAGHFLRELSRVTARQLSPEAGRLLEAHPWKGNVRELQQVMERAAILAEESTTVQPAHLHFAASVQERPSREESAQRSAF